MTRTLILSLIFISMNAVQAQAQLIDYNRRNKTQQQSVAPVEQKSSKSSAYRQTSSPEFTPINVTSKSEEAYDTNNDGLLQKDERDGFLKDVVNSVEEWGQYYANSAITKPFDVDRDGQINVNEVAQIRQLLNQ